ncbi:hypothetical protein LTR48_001846 [Friedmanniomyces endolithicus]|nr:hypothetical protein LTR29_002308 [Friedmanniomyces endolithicus]KAK1093687.1 hypothetical protein LTR48_001846 [Friedmanniomyces endolithicus]
MPKVSRGTKRKAEELDDVVPERKPARKAPKARTPKAKPKARTTKRKAPVRKAKVKIPASEKTFRISPVDHFNAPNGFQEGLVFEKTQMPDLHGGAPWLLPVITYDGWPETTDWQGVCPIQRQRQDDDELPVSPRTVATNGQMNPTERKRLELSH